jgi:NADPH:quinone reductase-like Zn-dependent oxidoreductase
MVRTLYAYGVRMRAAVHTRFGSPEVVELREVERPEPGEHQVLVRVHAAALNRLDWYVLTGTPLVGRLMGMRKPTEPQLGVDFAGVVEAVGEGVTDVRRGDEVFGRRSGALAEYVVAAEASIAPKPANVTFEEAAAVPVAAITALQALRDFGQLEPGQKVLVNGASGGVGTFTVQIAKALGGEVTAVCSTRNLDVARSLGADHVVDYTREDFSRGGRRYDLMVDISGDRSWWACRRVLERHGTLVVVGGPKGKVFGPILHLVKVKLAAFRSSRKVVFFISKPSKEHLVTLGKMIEAGQVKPFVDKTYTLDEAREALRYQGEAHPRGKVVVTI